MYHLHFEGASELQLCSPGQKLLYQLSELRLHACAKSMFLLSEQTGGFYQRNQKMSLYIISRMFVSLTLDIFAGFLGFTVIIGIDVGFIVIEM